MPSTTKRRKSENTPYKPQEQVQQVFSFTNTFHPPAVLRFNLTDYPLLVPELESLILKYVSLKGSQFGIGPRAVT
jgi:hypothetical protein